jgi:hypothetical protein
MPLNDKGQSLKAPTHALVIILAPASVPRPLSLLHPNPIFSYFQITDSEGNAVEGASGGRGGGYRYFGAAKALPGVKELFEKEAPKIVRKTRFQMHKSITPDYYGFRDEEDGVLVKVEAVAERAIQAQVAEQGCCVCTSTRVCESVCVFVCMHVCVCTHKACAHINASTACVWVFACLHDYEKAGRISRQSAARNAAGVNLSWEVAGPGAVLSCMPASQPSQALTTRHHAIQSRQPFAETSRNAPQLPRQ